MSLGLLYEHGEGVEQSFVEAVDWYRKAAVQGYAPAQLCLGNMYHWGHGVRQDDEQAAKWYANAYENGLEEAKEALDELDNER